MKYYTLAKNGCEFCEKQPIVLNIHLIKSEFREKFEKIFSEWDQKLWHGIDKDHQKELLDNLMKCFDDQKSNDITST